MATEEDAIAGRISKDVLKMNFMKRTTVKIAKQQNIQQQQQMREAIQSGKLAVEPPPYYPTVEHIDDDPNCTLGGVMSEWRYSMLEEYRFGRFSFHGQNPEIEKLMNFHERRRLGLADPDEEVANGDGGDDSDAEDGELMSSDEEEGGGGGERQARGRGEEDERPPEKKFRIGDIRSRQQRGRRMNGYQGGMDETTNGGGGGTHNGNKRRWVENGGGGGQREGGWRKAVDGGNGGGRTNQQHHQNQRRGGFRGRKGEGGRNNHRRGTRGGSS